ncbi:hypothetical protein [Treponema pectinovorum]|uniref:hypothetical protein n=1 Tax=Treponema pectinovorum TaxID=164 RepID=UPI0011CB734D|nr:hypothetical protein [Treponema pectinovorum]
MIKTDLIREFVDSKAIEAVEKIIDTEDISEINSLSTEIAGIFNTDSDFANIFTGADDSKLISSFKKNLTLLIQKTWVEKDDETVKEKLLYNLEQFCAYAEDGKYNSEYARFGHILTDVVYLMFGNMSKEENFTEYALRIDPQFGIFWWYIKNLPENANFSNEKCRALILIGMYFLANY